MSLESEPLSGTEEVRILRIRAWGNVLATLACLGAVGIMAHHPVVEENTPPDARLIIGIVFSIASLVTVTTAVKAFQGKFG